MATIEDKVKALQKSKAEEFSSACPSRTIELALDDLEAVEAQRDKYRIAMAACHSPSADGQCVVCFGGAVMANRLGADPEEHLLFDQGDWGENACCRLTALDHFRRGQIWDGLEAFGATLRGPLPRKVHVCDYRNGGRNGGKGFKADMRNLAAMLKQSGL